MYNDVCNADFDNGYMIFSTVLAIVLDAVILKVAGTVVFADPKEISGFAYTWATSDYKFVAWILIASVVISWILLISYISLAHEMQYYSSNKRTKTYAIAVNVIYYLHQCFSGVFFIVMPFVILYSVAVNFGNIVAYCTKFVLSLVDRVVNHETVHNTLNKDVFDATKSTYNDFEDFLNPPQSNYYGRHYKAYNRYR